jgi:Fe-Mn family superoxide dismutase
MQPARNGLVRALRHGLRAAAAEPASASSSTPAAGAAPLSTTAAPSASSSSSSSSASRLLVAAKHPATLPASLASTLVAAAPYATSSHGALKFALPQLPYAPSALEPVISGAIMALHHGKHHAAYVSNLNAALEQYAEAEAKGDLAKMLALQPAIHFNAGGHINHDIFWTNLAAEKDCRPPEGALKAAIEARWGSLDKLVGEFNAATAAVQGSGWGWLGYDAGTGGLAIATAANQDPLAKATGGKLVPLLGVDVWEHAYYLDYKNARPDYLKAIWRVVNWANVEERYVKAKAAGGK